MVENRFFAKKLVFYGVQITSRRGLSRLGKTTIFQGDIKMNQIRKNLTLIHANLFYICAFSLGLNLIASLLFDSFVAPILLTSVVIVGSKYYVSSLGERKTMIRDIVVFVRRSSVGVIMRALAIYGGVFVASRIESPEDSFLVTMGTTTSSLVWFASMFYIIVKMVAATSNARTPQDAWKQCVHLFDVVLGVAVLMSMFHWALGVFGDEIARSVLESPVESAGVVLSLIFAWVILSMSSKVPNIVGYKGDSSSKAQDYMPSFEFSRNTLSEQDAEVTAIHEIGHLLPFAALEGVPEDTVVVVNGIFEDSVAGYVYATAPHTNGIQHSSYVEWSMLNLLGGAAAEKEFLGINFLGSGSDYEKWQSFARSYASNQLGDMYFITPESSAEATHNAAILASLLQDQMSTLVKFLRDNESVFMELKDLLQEKKKLVASDISPLISKVVVPESFPQPKAHIDQAGC